MSGEWRTGDQFIDSWLEKQGEEGRLDQEILSLIEESRSGSTLAVEKLLERLIAVSDGREENDAEG